MLVNPRDFGPDDEEKVKIMIKAAIKHSIDRILFSSPDRKWTLNKIERLKQKFKRISKEVEIISSNSDQEPRTNSGYLPGGILSILIGRITGMKI